MPCHFCEEIPVVFGNQGLFLNSEFCDLNQEQTPKGVVAAFVGAALVGEQLVDEVSLLCEVCGDPEAALLEDDAGGRDQVAFGDVGAAACAADRGCRRLADGQSIHRG